MRKFALGLVLISLTACQQPPKTRVYRKGSQDFVAMTKSLKYPIRIDEKTKLLDARSHFDFGLSHAENSSHIKWDGYSITNTGKTSRRLALLGVSPDTPVVVLGDGHRGSGEEGRVAWMLMYLGIKDVQTSSLDALKLRRAKGDERNAENKENWSPKLNLHLMADAREVVGNAVGKKEKGIHIIDVRSPKEYFEKDALEVRGVNIEWKEFFTSTGRPSLRMKNKLQNIGINPNDRIVIVSNQGLRSGAATYALTMIGFRNVGNFAAGWKSLK